MPASVYSVPQYEDEEDQYYGEDELTEAEKELAMKSEQRVVYTEVYSDDELPLENHADGGQDVERDSRHADELERERKRQLELDRRIRDWKTSEKGEELAVSVDSGVRDIVKCQICGTDLSKGSMWCPRCGSEQI